MWRCWTQPTNVRARFGRGKPSGIDSTAAKIKPFKFTKPNPNPNLKMVFGLPLFARTPPKCVPTCGRLLTNANLVDHLLCCPRLRNQRKVRHDMMLRVLRLTCGDADILV